MFLKTHTIIDENVDTAELVHRQLRDITPVLLVRDVHLHRYRDISRSKILCGRSHAIVVQITQHNSTSFLQVASRYCFAEA